MIKESHWDMEFIFFFILIFFIWELKLCSVADCFDIRCWSSSWTTVSAHKEVSNEPSWMNVFKVKIKSQNFCIQSSADRLFQNSFWNRWRTKQYSSFAINHKTGYLLFNICHRGDLLSKSVVHTHFSFRSNSHIAN